MSPDPTVTAGTGLYLTAGVLYQFDLVHGYDTRMPVYMVRATSTDGTVTARVDSQEDKTDEFEGV
jgi:hypothetical protein